MKIFCTASKDTYITNKVISGTSKVESNLGRAGTLDLFKIYDENNDKVEDGIEISRLLIKFDLQRVRNLLNTKIDLNDESFNARIKLFDVSSGVPKPAGFDLEVLPLNVNFDEGIGRDVSSYADFDAANFLAASYSNGASNDWNLPGANAKGYTDDDVDVIIGIETETFDCKQRFEEGDEDLSIDVTEIIKNVLDETIPDHGFRISFVEDQEEDDKSRLLKRFASRHVINPQIRPRLEISIDDSEFDDRRNAYLDNPIRLSLENRIAGARKNIVIASEELAGNDCIGLEISYGDLAIQSIGSQRTVGTFDDAVQGVYESYITIPSDSTFDDSNITLGELLESNSTLIFDERWFPASDPTKTIKRDKLTISKIAPSSELFGLPDLEFRLQNLKNRYRRDTVERVRVFVYDPNHSYKAARTKTLRLRSLIVSNVHYSIRDTHSGQTIIDYDFDKGSTRASYDADGLYFDADTSVLIQGRTYSFDFSIYDEGKVQYTYRSKEAFGVF
jgi:hypothetical protein